MLADFGTALALGSEETHQTADELHGTFNYMSPESFDPEAFGHMTSKSDVWSFACLVFELATGDLLFDPRSGRDYDRDEDHLALIAELVGRPPRRVWGAGKRAKDFFSRTGELRHIKRLKHWPLQDVLCEKYGMPRHEVGGMR